jgi:hypothetical protein
MKIEQCVALREIRGLKWFEMIFPPVFNMAFDEKTQYRLLHISEDIKEVVTRERE